MNAGDIAIQNLSIARRVLLDPYGLDEAHLQRALADIFTHRVDYADLYFQYTRNEAWSLEEGIVKSGSFSIDQGVGVRAVSGDRTAFAYSDDISLPALMQAAGATRTIGKAGSGRVKVANSLATGPSGHSLYAPKDPLDSMTASEKVALLERIEKLARAKDPRVVQVMAGLAGEYDVMLVARSDGVIAADVRPLVRISVTVIAEQNGRREMGSSGGGGRYAYGYFTDDLLREYVDEAVSSALVNLEAKPAPAGTMTVVLGPGWPGVLLHEAVGHGLEGDFNRKGTSMFAKMMGQQVASSLCTVVDDGTLPDRRGSLTVDDEGTPGGYNTLIENGKLVGHMQDKTNARLMGVAPTGNGRRESYAHLPMPRMTNTYMLPGESDPEEILASLDRGIYAVNFGGGQVDITSGRFVFSTSEAYLVEKGKIVCPVKGATLIGSGAEVMNRISMVGNDLALDSGIGVCGKDGQSVPVGVGQPTLRVDALTVGGTA